MKPRLGDLVTLLQWVETEWNLTSMGLHQGQVYLVVQELYIPLRTGTAILLRVLGQEGRECTAAAAWLQVVSRRSTCATEPEEDQGSPGTMKGTPRE
jgi:hypothetical protein